MFAEKERQIETPFSVERIEDFELETLIETVDQTFHFHLTKKQYQTCEEVLTNFCYDLLDFTEEQQLFIARVHFTSIVTGINRFLTQKELLHSEILVSSFKIISTIETWKNISEYLLHISWFIKQVKHLVVNYPLSIRSHYVEQAIRIIHHHLTEHELSVQWLSDHLEITPTHLANLFKMEVGESISHYIARRKIDEVIYELTYTNNSLKDIRIKYGFSNHSHFIQHFKKLQGITPLQFVQKQYLTNT